MSVQPKTLSFILIDLKKRRDCDDITWEEKKLNANNHSCNEKFNFKQNPNAQHKSFHLNPHNLNIPNIQKPPITNTALSLSFNSLIPRLFSRSPSETRFQPSTSRNHPRAKFVSKKDRQGLNEIFFCMDTTDSPIIDHHIKKNSHTVYHIENHRIFFFKSLIHTCLGVHPWWPPFFVRLATELKSCVAVLRKLVGRT